VCVAGTRWVQGEILEKNSNPDLIVYAVWFKMLASDGRDTWPGSLLDDPRVVELWDEPRVLGRWLASQPQFESKGLVGGGVMWDTFLLFGRKSRWEGVPTHLVSWGHTIVGARKRLEADLPVALAPVGSGTP
jgi:hypothetical protein